MEIFNNISLKSYSTFAVGGTPRYFLIIKNREDVVVAFDFIKSKIKEKDISNFYILGSGSNSIFSNDLENICVLKVGIAQDFEILENKSTDKEILIKSSAGNSWDDLVSFCTEKNLYGLENLSYIPGSVGAAPVQNIGAYGVEVKDYIHSIEVYDIEKETFQNVKNEDNIFDFGYRDSVFKKFKNKYLIISVTFKLKFERDINVKYQGLEIGNSDDAKGIREKVINIRKSKLPDPREIPNCGSFFKNPIVSKVELDNILNINKDIKYFTNGDDYKLSAASLIESLALKGYAVGGASISLNHALIMINKEKLATYEDVKNLSEYIINHVRDKYEVSLEREVNMI